MGLVTFGAPRDLAIAIRDCFDLECFVETGTNEGETAAWAAGHFSSVVTVEADQEIQSRAAARLSALNNVTCYLGESPSVLARVIHELPRSLFWLDAHWCAPGTAGKAAECPLISELAVVAPHLQKHAILIDDARFFVAPAPIEHNYLHWPSLDDIFRIVQASAQTYTVLHADTLLIVPAIYRMRVTDLLRDLGK